jgi:hypothetical protein
MRIGQIARLHERPPKFHGGTEGVVSFQEFMRPGQDIPLFVNGESDTSAKLAGWREIAFPLNPGLRISLSYHTVMLDEVCRTIDELDVLHFHNDLVHASDIRDIRDRTPTTLHARLDVPNLARFYVAFLSLVSIFNERQNFSNNENCPRTIQAADLLPFCPNHQGYLTFLGRISLEKRAHQAIEIAVRSCMQLKLARKVDRVDRAYWREEGRLDGSGRAYRASNRRREQSHRRRWPSAG